MLQRKCCYYSVLLNAFKIESKLQRDTVLSQCIGGTSCLLCPDAAGGCSSQGPDGTAFQHVSYFAEPAALWL